jgi:nicotinamide-nucleotide amidase
MRDPRDDHLSRPRTNIDCGIGMNVTDLVTRIGSALKGRERFLVTAESCTGGWVARELTAVPGCSHWFERGFVTYTNVSKQEMLGVRPQTLEAYGAVSEPTVREMAEGALRHSHAQVAVAISGIAGPGGGSADKPVGTVWLAWAGTWFPTIARRELYSGGREAVRRQAVVTALEQLLELVGGDS